MESRAAGLQVETPLDGVGAGGPTLSHTRGRAIVKGQFAEK